MIASTRYRLQAQVDQQNRLSQTIGQEQTQISTGVRIQNPSDDPAAAARVATIASAQMNQTTWTSNIKLASAISDQADTVLTGIATNLQRANELMVNATSQTLSDTDRSAIAVELNGIAQDIDAAMATKDSRGADLFSASTPLSIPVGNSLNVTVAPSKDQTFNQVQTAGGVKGISDIIRNAASVIGESDPAQRQADSNAALAETQNAVDHIRMMRAQQGSLGSRIDTVTDQLANTDTQLTAERSGLEDTDLTTTVAKMQANMLSLQAAQSTFAKLSQINLFDYLK